MSFMPNYLLYDISIPLSNAVASVVWKPFHFRLRIRAAYSSSISASVRFAVSGLERVGVNNFRVIARG